MVYDSESASITGLLRNIVKFDGKIYFYSDFYIKINFKIRDDTQTSFLTSILDALVLILM